MPHVIPARIIQTAKSDRLPLLQRAVAKNVRLLHPTFDYLFFDDRQVEAFLDREYPQYRWLFDSFRFPIQRYDFFRYLAVYRYGGFYLDLDVLLASSLSGLTEFGCVFPFEGLTFSHLLRSRYDMDWEIGNYAFGAAPGHPFLAAVIRQCVRAARDPGWAAEMMRGSPLLLRHDYFVLNTTGPGLLSRTLAENPHLVPLVTVLFPDDVCDARRWNRFGELGIHLMEGSWRPTRGPVWRRLAGQWEAWKTRMLVRRSLTSGKTRQAVRGVLLGSESGVSNTRPQ